MSTERQPCPTSEALHRAGMNRLTAAGRGGAVACDELRTILLLLGEGRIRFEAAAAAGFVSAHGADDDKLFAFDESLGVHSRIAAADANGEQFGDFFGDSEEARHG